MNIPVQDLIDRARAARRLAYAPYSGFRVGAALFTRSGRIYTGCNVENASYGLTVCAERVAIFTAVACGEKEFLALAVYAGTDEFCFPCGACRQVLAEFGGHIEVYMVNERGEYLVRSVAELLPSTFVLSPPAEVN